MTKAIFSLVLSFGLATGVFFSPDKGNQPDTNLDRSSLAEVSTPNIPCGSANYEDSGTEAPNSTESSCGTGGGWQANAAAKPEQETPGTPVNPLTQDVLNPEDCARDNRPLWCSGSDIGAWTNAAIAHLGAAGTIYIPDGTYRYSTTISISQAQFKTLTIRCGSRAATLIYTGMGDAVSVTSNLNSAAQVTIENCSFSGNSAGASANGFVLYDAWNFRAMNASIYGFKGLNVSCTGCIDAVFLNSDVIGAGSWNVKLTTDTGHSIGSNANQFVGGSIAYGGAGNVWDAGAGDQLNTFRGVTFEENTAAPQVLLEGVSNDAVEDSYVEYRQASTSATLCSLVLGNRAHSGWGSDSAYTAHYVRLSNLYMATPASRTDNMTAHVCFINSTYSHLEDINAFGGPKFGAYFDPSGNNLDNTIGPSGLRYKGAQYNITPPGNLLWVPYGTYPAAGQWTYGKNGEVQFGSIDSSGFKSGQIEGFTGTKVVGSCKFKIVGGIITAITGC